MLLFSAIHQCFKLRASVQMAQHTFYGTFRADRMIIISDLGFIYCHMAYIKNVKCLIRYTKTKYHNSFNASTL